MLTIYTYGQISVMTHAVGIQPALSNTPLDSTDRSVQEPLGVEYIPTRADEADMPDVPSHRPNPGTFVWISWRRGSLVSLDHMEVQLERGPHQIGNSVGARLLADEGGHLESILRVINKILPQDHESGLYDRFLQHEDMSLNLEDDDAEITSLYDWETGFVIPRISRIP